MKNIPDKIAEQTINGIRITGTIELYSDGSYRACGMIDQTMVSLLELRKLQSTNSSGDL